ncbi:hypothetical protein ABIC01_009214 [Bradyrhizobium sp. RT4b]
MSENLAGRTFPFATYTRAKRNDLAPPNVAGPHEVRSAPLKKWSFPGPSKSLVLASISSVVSYDFMGVQQKCL